MNEGTVAFFVGAWMGLVTLGALFAIVQAFS